MNCIGIQIDRFLEETDEEAGPFRASSLKQHSFTRLRSLYTRSALGFSLAGWDEPNWFVRYSVTPAAAYRVIFVLLADPLLTGRGTATGNLWRNVNGAALGKFPGREVTSVIDQTTCFRWFGEETPRPSTYIHLLAIRLSEHEARATCFRVLIL